MPINKTEVFVYSSDDSTGSGKRGGGSGNARVSAASELRLACSSTTVRGATRCTCHLSCSNKLNYIVSLFFFPLNRWVNFALLVPPCHGSTADLSFPLQEDAHEGESIGEKKDTGKKRTQTSGMSSQSAGVPLLRRQKSQGSMGNSLATRNFLMQRHKDGDDDLRGATQWIPSTGVFHLLLEIFPGFQLFPHF